MTWKRPGKRPASNSGPAGGLLAACERGPCPQIRAAARLAAWPVARLTVSAADRRFLT